jgi:peroxiredoxin
MTTANISILFPRFTDLEKAMERHGVDITIMPINDLFAAVAKKLNELEPCK